LILALKKHAVFNAITSINNSLMQLKIILIGVTSSKFLCFCSIFVLISSKKLLFSASGSGGAASSPSRFLGGALHGSQSIFGFYIASNSSKAVLKLL